MRRLAPLLLVGLAACYAPRSVTMDPGSPGLYGSGVEQEPLQATLWMNPHAPAIASFDLNRPAHVAIFAWQPGTHFRMVYPSIGYRTEQYFKEGRHHMWTDSRRHLAPGSLFRRVADVPAARRGPTYFVLIASEAPLEVSPFYAVERSLWIERVTWSYNPYTATELLASQIVPGYGTTEWTVAYQVLWYERDMPPAPRYVWIRCPGGVTLTVPESLAYSGLVQCPEVATDGVLLPPDTARGRAVPRPVSIPAGWMDPERPGDDELEDLIRGIREARGEATDDVTAPPPPPWRLGDREGRRETPVATPDRPDIRPMPTGVSRPEARRAPAPSRDRPVAERPARPSAEREPARTEPARPKVTRPTTPPDPPRRPPPDPPDGSTDDPRR
jgi:hypothetical protein